MAVYKRTFTTYDGPVTTRSLRFTILTRYAFKTLLETRLAATLFTICLLPHVIGLAFIYLRNNLDMVRALGLRFPAERLFSLFSIDGAFFGRVLGAECWLTFIAIALIGPGLVSPDLTNSALPLFLSRPFSRREYVAGKFATLAVIASGMTWVPALVLVAFQVSLAGPEWLGEHARIVSGIVAGSWIWITAVSLIALALSAWVKWKPIAVASLFGVFFVGAAFGEAANDTLGLDPRWGTLLNLRATMNMLWAWLLSGDSVYMGAGGSEGIPSWTGLVSMGGFCALSLALLTWKIRSAEVVRE
ncbi:MAG TPA: hypothetical protein VFY29_04635 [Terriglobia bacterium]|nr:hypothetical protein [Terriglobia bacterium]